MEKNIGLITALFLLLTDANFDEIKAQLKKHKKEISEENYQKIINKIEELEQHEKICCCAKNEVLILENIKLKELLMESNNWVKAFYAYEKSNFVRRKVASHIKEVEKILGVEDE